MQRIKAIEPDFRIISLQNLKWNFEAYSILILQGFLSLGASKVFIWTYNVLNLALKFTVLGAILNT